ncbi:MAG: N-6 DNA methylase [Ginsengibacter sp.]
MLTSELRKNIDEKWNACWPLSTLRPIAILDLISFLFFFKKISGHILVSENSENKLNSDFANPKEKQLITWTTFKTLDEQSMHAVFSGENGVLDLVKKYHKHSTYEVFLRGNLLLSPTQKLLFNATGIIKLMEGTDDNTKGSIFEYLLNKTEVIGQNGQAFLPGYLSDLMISIIQPQEKDWILDSSAANGNLLVNSLKYISNKNPEFSRNLINNFGSARFVGIESDLTNIRICGMNMLLNGIPNPELKVLNSSPPLNSITTEQPTAFVANLVFTTADNKSGSEGTSVREAIRKETFHLNFILKNSKPGTRAVVIVPDVFLYNIGTEIIKLRQEIIDNFRLEGVISVNDKNAPQFLGTSIIIFSKENTSTDKVWFYKIESKEKSNQENENPESSGNNKTKDISEQLDTLKDIIKQFRNRDIRTEKKNQDFFYITAEDIRSRNYNLSYNEYILFLNQEIKVTNSETNPIEKRIGLNQIKNQTLFPAAEKIPLAKKSHAKKIIIISILSIIIIGGGFLSYWIFYLKKDFPFFNKPASIAIKPKDSIIFPSKNKTKITIPLRDSTDITPIKYVVNTKAYFYSSPDSNSIRNIYINRYSNTILIPTDEKNGFVYVVYNNKRGESTKGWLNKKDLRPAK